MRNTKLQLLVLLMLATTAFAQQPAKTVADFDAAGIAQKAGKCEEALQHFGEAIKLNPKDLTAQMNSGICYMVLRRRDEALSAFKIAIALAPNDARVHFGLAQAQ